MKKARSSSESSTHGIIVSGEASESDEDDVDIRFAEDTGFTCVDQNYYAKGRKSDSGINRKKSPNRKDLLQQRLYEANISLHKCIVSEFEKPVSESSRKILKLDTRLSSVHNPIKISTITLSRAIVNVDNILNTASLLDSSHLPTRRPLDD